MEGNWSHEAPGGVTVEDGDQEIFTLVPPGAMKTGIHETIRSGILCFVK